MSRPVIYYAHPMSDYGSDREQRAVDALELAGYEVLNPNGQEHQAACAAEKAAGGTGMAYFLRIAVDCDAIAFSPFPDGLISAGVGAEVDAFAHAWSGDRPIFELWDHYKGPNNADRIVALVPMSGIGSEDRWRVLSVDKTREKLRGGRR